jgi:hypothetical protein
MGDRHHWTRLGRIVKCQGLIVMRSSFGDIACMQQRLTKEGMAQPDAGPSPFVSRER